MSVTIAAVRCENYDAKPVETSVEHALGLLGGIESFIKPGSTVLVKPNLLIAKAPELGITTHPEVVRAVIRQLKRINCSVRVGDGPSVWKNQLEKYDDVCRLTGMRAVCDEEQVALVDFNKRRWHGAFPLTTQLDECQYIVNVPKFKTHSLMLLTGAIKNLFGLVSGTYKTELHKKYFYAADLAKVIVDIYQKAKPSLTVIDGIIAMEGDGPGTSGTLRQMNLVLAGSDCVALDAVLAYLMGVKPEDVLTTKEAAARGLGIADLRKISIAGESLGLLRGKPFRLPASTKEQRKVPAPVLALAQKLIKYYPCVEQDNCIACARCINICPQKAMSMNENRVQINCKKCISCFCCQESCPASAIKIKRSLIAKMIGL